MAGAPNDSPGAAVGRPSGDGAELDPAADDAVLTFLRSVELAAVALYTGVSPLLGSPAAVAVAAAAVRHHADHAAALAGAGGPLVPIAANQALMAEWAPAMMALSTEIDTLGFLSGVENALAATHHHALGKLTTVVALQQVAAIAPVEAEHAVVIGTLLGRQLHELVPAFQGDDGRFSPSQYPVG